MESVWTFSRKWQKRAPSGTDKSRLWSDPNEPSLRWGPIFLHWHLWEAHPRSALKNNFNLECSVASYCTSSYYNESLVGSDTHPRVHGLQFLKYLSCGEGGLLWALRVHTLGCWRWCWGIWDRRERERERKRASSVLRLCTKHVFLLEMGQITWLEWTLSAKLQWEDMMKDPISFAVPLNSFPSRNDNSSPPDIQKKWIFSHFALPHSNPVTLRWSYHIQTLRPLCNFSLDSLFLAST